MRRLALKRPAVGTGPDDGKRRAGAPPAQPAQQPPVPQSSGAKVDTENGGSSDWVSDFAAEVDQASVKQHRRRQQPAEPRHGYIEGQPLAAQQAQQGRHHAADDADADDLEVIPESSSEGEDDVRMVGVLQRAAAPTPPSPPSPALDDEARQGLVKVAESMQRRVDAGRVQLEAQRRLLAQKQALLRAGEAVLAEHCRASWLQNVQLAAAAPQAGSAWAGSSSSSSSSSSAGSNGGCSVTVHSLQAECAAGQWWLMAEVSLPGSTLPPGASSSGGGLHPNNQLSLLAASTECSLVCRQQHCAVLGPAGGEAPDGGLQAADPAGQAGATRLQLAAALDVQQVERGWQAAEAQQQGEASPPAADAWADVFLLAEGAARDGSPAPMCAPLAPPPILLGRVQLRWQDWLRSHARPAMHMPGCEQWEVHLNRVLAVTCLEPASVDLEVCLQRVVQQHLGCVPAPQADNSSGGQGSTDQPQEQVYVLPGSQGAPAQQQQQQQQQHQGRQARGVKSAAQPAAAASVLIRLHSEHFAEIELQGCSDRMLDVMEQQLGVGLAAAAAAAGAPAGSLTLQPSLLPPQHAQHIAAAADALVSDLDASMEWLEALLKQKLAIGSLHRRRRDCPPDFGAADLRARQDAALAAMAVTDDCMIHLLI